MSDEQKVRPTHNCTGPGCVGCYAVANNPRFSEHAVELSEYEQRIQDRWERGER